MTQIILGAVGGLIIGGIISFFIINSLLKKRKDAIIKKAQSDAEILLKEKQLQAKEKFLHLKADHEKQVNFVRF